MSVKVDINDIIGANSHTSAMSLTKSWADTFKKYALNKNEELSDDPGSSFNIFLHFISHFIINLLEGCLLQHFVFVHCQHGYKSLL